MSVTLHGIANCDSVKRARASLGAQGIAHDFRDYKKTPPTRAELERWADALGWEVLLNRRGTTWRRLPDADRTGVDRDRALALMLAHPSLIRRPLVEDDGRVSVGLPEGAREGG